MLAARIDLDNRLAENAISRENLVAVISDFFTDTRNGDEYLSDLLNATGLLPVEASDYAGFRALLASSGWDMTFTE